MFKAYKAYKSILVLNREAEEAYAKNRKYKSDGNAELAAAYQEKGDAYSYAAYRMVQAYHSTLPVRILGFLSGLKDKLVRNKWENMPLYG